MPFIKNVHAKVINPVLPDSLDISSDPTTYTNKVIQTIFSIFILVAVIYFVFRFILGGYKMISSNGDQKKYEEAIASIRYSLTGLIIVFSIFIILKLIGNIFGITSLRDGLSIPWPGL